MRIQSTILTTLLLLYGCGGGNKEITINAPGLSGIGGLEIGQTSEESLSILTEREDYELFLTDYGFADSNTPDIKGVKGKITSTGGEEIELTLTFYRDTLQIIDLGKIGGASEKARDGLLAKFGEGQKAGTENNFMEKWVGERATAVYIFASDNNPDPYQRRTKETLQITPTGRDIEAEISEYAKTIKDKIESERTEDLETLF